MIPECKRYYYGVRQLADELSVNNKKRIHEIAMINKSPIGMIFLSWCPACAGSDHNVKQ